MLFDVLLCGYQMLCLSGETYIDRLWCVWEVFTVCAFTSREQMKGKIVWKSLGGSSAKDMKFSLANAKCFNPNEEARLRMVIRARGEKLFESRIREILAACQDAVPSATAPNDLEVGTSS